MSFQLIPKELWHLVVKHSPEHTHGLIPRPRNNSSRAGPKCGVLVNRLTLFSPEAWVGEEVSWNSSGRAESHAGCLEREREREREESNDTNIQHVPDTNHSDKPTSTAQRQGD